MVSNKRDHRRDGYLPQSHQLDYVERIELPNRVRHGSDFRANLFAEPLLQSFRARQAGENPELAERVAAQGPPAGAAHDRTRPRGKLDRLSTALRHREMTTTQV